MSTCQDDDIKYCNCSLCGVECLGESCLGHRDRLTRNQGRGIPFVIKRVKGRPVCNLCWNYDKMERIRSLDNCGVRKYSESEHTSEPSPWLENAVKELEG